MKWKQKHIRVYPEDERIVELVQANYNCSFNAALRMIIRDWGRRLELVEKALALQEITSVEYKQCISELTTLAVH